MLKTIRSIKTKKITTKDETKRSIKTYSFFIIYCFILMLFCTKSSPLYAINDWFDANIYYTMGKGLMNGKVPYVDLIDNKGPLLYLLYGIAWLISRDVFTGMYIIQSVFLSLSVIFAYRLTQLYISNRTVAGLAAILTPVPMLVQRLYAPGFDNGGGGPDELCRALLVIALYYFALYFEKPHLYKPRHTIIQGVLFSCVFMMKFNIAAFWAGFLLVIICTLLYRKRYKDLLRHIADFLIGAAIVVIPYIIYALVTGSLGAFIDTYFMYNSIYSGTEAADSLIIKVITSLTKGISELGGRWAFAVAILAGLVFVLLKTENRFSKGYAITLPLFLVASFFTGVHAYAYVYYPITIFTIFGIIALCFLIERNIAGAGDAQSAAGTANTADSNFTTKAVCAAVVFLLTCGMNNLVSYELFLTDEQTAQEQMAEMIWDNADTGTPTLLEIGGLDSGFYTAAGILPDEPYFFIYNISHEDFPYPRDAQKKAVNEGTPDFVICRSIVNDAESGVIYNFDIPNPYKMKRNYDYIGFVQGKGYQSKLTYHLFKVKAPGGIFDDNAVNKIVTVADSMNAGRDNTANVLAMFDRDEDTRWTSGKSQETGDFLIIEFTEPVRYNCLFMDTGAYWNDYPRELTVSVSDDGEIWEEVEIKEEELYYFARFEIAAPYRFIKLTIGGSVSNWWGIYEMEFGTIE